MPDPARHAPYTKRLFLAWKQEILPAPFCRPGLFQGSGLVFSSDLMLNGKESQRQNLRIIEFRVHATSVVPRFPDRHRRSITDASASTHMSGPLHLGLNYS